jgi:hypothetical protein
MTFKKFKDYTFEELINSQDFISIVQNISTESEWIQFLEFNKESKDNIIQARKFILLFNTKEVHLDTDKKHELWLKIRDFKRNEVTFIKKINFRVALKIAASVLVILSLSGILFFSLYNNETEFEFTQTASNPNSGNSVLLITNGDKIEVQKDESKITMLGNQKGIQVNNDTIQTKNLTSDSSDGEQPLNELIVPYGKKTMLTLIDGTKVWLNAGSKFAFPQKFIGKKRTVYLDGEGYFEVAKNEKQPFIVSSGNIKVEVLGTKFNVNSYSSDNSSETILLEGKVNIWTENSFLKDKTQLLPNQKAVYNTTSNEITVETALDAENYIVWIDGWYRFSNERLEQVLLKLERYYNIDFQYNKDQINKAKPISGKLDLKDSYLEVMQILANVAEIEYKIEGEKIIIN